MNTALLQSLIYELYIIVNKHEVAATRFRLTLNPVSTEGFDPTGPDGTRVAALMILPHQSFLPWSQLV